MNFFVDDEFLLLMNHNLYRVHSNGKDPYHTLTTGEKERLNKVGIQTAHEQPAWHTLEPECGHYNFGYLDEIIKSNRDAGMKSLIQLSGWMVPKWMPNEWFAKTKEGKVEREALSFWNEEAQAYSDNFYRFLRDRYASYKDVQFFFGEWQGGEGAYPPTWCLYDAPAIEDYKKIYGNSAIPDPNTSETMNWYGNKIIEHFVRKAEILYPPYKEIWNAQQYLMDTWSKAFGNFVQHEILVKHREMHPDGCIVLLQYTYFDSSHDENNVKYVDRLREISGCEVIAEAMFCNGLPITTPKSIAKGFRGQIVHPAAGGFDNGLLEDWMVDRIRDSHNLWMESKNK